MKGVIVTVQTTATLILDGTSGSSVYERAAIVSVPSGGQTVFLGGPDVDATNGFPMAAGTSIELQVVNEGLYGIVGASTQAVNVLRSGD